MYIDIFVCKTKLCQRIKKGMNMWKCEFYDTEFLDGYFSGVIYLYIDNRRYILSFGYDVEFESLKLMNCMEPMYYTGEKYTIEELSELYVDNMYLIINEIKNEIKNQIGAWK